MYIFRFVIVIIGVCGLLLVYPPCSHAEESLQDQRIKFYTTKADGEYKDNALDEAAIALLKEELYYVQLQIERYSVDYTPRDEAEACVYPYCINELCAQTWSSYRKNFVSYLMPGLYPNPLRSTETTERNAQCVPFGWDDALSPGNFSYLTRYDQESGKVNGYVILGYGPTRESGMDVDGDGEPDGVVIVLYSSTLYEVPQDTSLTLFDNGSMVTVVTN